MMVPPSTGAWLPETETQEVSQQLPPQQASKTRRAKLSKHVLQLPVEQPSKQAGFPFIFHDVSYLVSTIFHLTE